MVQAAHQLKEDEGSGVLRGEHVIRSRTLVPQQARDDADRDELHKLEDAERLEAPRAHGADREHAQLLRVPRAQPARRQRRVVSRAVLVCHSAACFARTLHNNASHLVPLATAIKGFVVIPIHSASTSTRNTCNTHTHRFVFFLSAFSSTLTRGTSMMRVPLQRMPSRGRASASWYFGSISTCAMWCRSPSPWKPSSHWSRKSSMTCAAEEQLDVQSER
jgi:hypothetical protein